MKLLPLFAGLVVASVAIVATYGGPSAVFADGPAQPAWAKKVLPWRPELLPIGGGWWCNDVLCQRRRDDCELNASPCDRQISAWGFSVYSRAHHVWLVMALPTQEACDAAHERAMGMHEMIGISACVSIEGRLSPGKKPPAGSGWWCYRYGGYTAPTPVKESRCWRTEIECKENESITADSPYLALSSGCSFHRKAWYSTAPSGNPDEPLFSFHTTKTDCRYWGLGGSCKPVR